MKQALVLALATGALASCSGSTGGELLDFDAFVAGPAGLTSGEPYVFVTPRGFTVTLTRATLHVGAVYLNRSVPTSVSSDESCFLSGLYVAEVPGGLDVDVLDPQEQLFPVKGLATTERARTAEVWLSGGDIETENDSAVIAHVEGTAQKGSDTFPFEGTVTIGDNRKLPPPDDSQPGFNPICKQRIVTPIVVDITPTPGGSLVLRIDPAGWFSNVAFEKLEKVGNQYRFRDDSDDQPSRNFYGGIRSNSGVYEFTWEE